MDAKDQTVIIRINFEHAKYSKKLFGLIIEQREIVIAYVSFANGKTKKYNTTDNPKLYCWRNAQVGDVVAITYDDDYIPIFTNEE